MLKDILAWIGLLLLTLALCWIAFLRWESIPLEGETGLREPSVASESVYRDGYTTSTDTRWRDLPPKLYLLARYPEYADEINSIIKCESGWNAEATNNTSTATGLCQFLDSTWTSTRVRMGKYPDLVLRTDAYIHIDTCVWLFKTDGPRHWLASERCHRLNGYEAI